MKTLTRTIHYGYDDYDDVFFLQVYRPLKEAPELLEDIRQHWLEIGINTDDLEETLDMIEEFWEPVDSPKRFDGMVAFMQQYGADKEHIDAVINSRPIPEVTLVREVQE